MNVLREEKTKICVPMKQKHCMLNPAFLEQLLLAVFAPAVN